MDVGAGVDTGVGTDAGVGIGVVPLWPVFADASSHATPVFLCAAMGTDKGGERAQAVVRGPVPYNVGRHDGMACSCPWMRWGRERVVRIRWVDGFEISAVVREGEVVVSANREGLLSLASILTDLANEQPGAHVHLDEYNALEEGSAELIIEHTD